MQKLGSAVLLALLAGCATPCPADIGQIVRQAAYRCVDGTELSVSFARQPALALISVNGQRAFTLPAQQASEGFRYAGAGGAFTGAGDAANWNPAGAPETQCSAEN